MIKIGIYGGAFDPVHIGHIRLARQAAAELKLDKLLIIPTSVSPHKENAQTSYDDRFRMLELAFAQDKKFEISDIEKHISGKSFTINTVRALREIYPSDAVFYLIIGADMLFSFKKWYRYEALLGECKVVAAAREEDSYVDMLEFANEVGRIKVLNLPVTEVSSTEIREKLSKNEDVSSLVPQEVIDYINEKGLYRE